VRLFSRLALQAAYARNLGDAPVPSAGGFVGPGASVTLHPGVRLGESVWEIHVPKARLVRVVKADLAAELDEAGALRIVAGMERREYASGVVAAELAHPDADAEAALGAAVLRFLGRGPRHQGFDLCDSTHCAFFIGRGPRTRWLEPGQASAVGGVLHPLDDALWQRARTLAESPGPDHWTSHCGGQPLSAHAVWANGDRSVQACALHGPSSARPWRRAWSDRDLERAFGADVRGLRVRTDDGVWRLEVTRDAGDVSLLLYDDAHRRLAAGLGWGSLPSPAERVFRSAGGWQAEGVGLGHRVGLCLGASERRLTLLDPGLWPRPELDAELASGDGSSR
jgi:hypothetical protein